MKVGCNMGRHDMLTLKMSNYNLIIIWDEITNMVGTWDIIYMVFVYLHTKLLAISRKFGLVIYVTPKQMSSLSHFTPLYFSHFIMTWSSTWPYVLIFGKTWHTYILAAPLPQYYAIQSSFSYYFWKISLIYNLSTIKRHKCIIHL